MEGMGVRQELLGNTPRYVQLILEQTIKKPFLPSKKTLETVEQSGLFSITCTINFAVRKVSK